MLSGPLLLSFLVQAHRAVHRLHVEMSISVHICIGAFYKDVKLYNVSGSLLGHSSASLFQFMKLLLCLCINCSTCVLMQIILSLY